MSACSSRPLSAGVACRRETDWPGAEMLVLMCTAMRQGPYREAWDAGAIVRGETLEALAQAFGMPPAFFESEKAVKQNASSGKVLTAPYYAAWVTGALAHTQGGLAVDGRARVLRADSSVIPGLFAAGGAAAGLAGHGGEGYLPGNGLAQSFALGLIAGEEMCLLRSRA